MERQEGEKREDKEGLGRDEPGWCSMLFMVGRVLEGTHFGCRPNGMPEWKLD